MHHVRIIKGGFRWYSKRLVQINNCYFLINCQQRTSCWWTNKTSFSFLSRLFAFNFIKSRQINYLFSNTNFKYWNYDCCCRVVCVSGEFNEFLPFSIFNTHWMCKLRDRNRTFVRVNKTLIMSVWMGVVSISMTLFKWTTRTICYLYFIGWPPFFSVCVHNNDTVVCLENT